MWAVTGKPSRQPSLLAVFQLDPRNLQNDKQPPAGHRCGQPLGAIAPTLIDGSAPTGPKEPSNDKQTSAGHICAQSLGGHRANLSQLDPRNLQTTSNLPPDIDVGSHWEAIAPTLIVDSVPIGPKIPSNDKHIPLDLNAGSHWEPSRQP